MLKKIPEFKYKTSFSSVLKPKKEGILRGGEAVAALRGIDDIFPKDINNVALLPIAFDACNVNLANENGDVIDTETAIDIYKHFEHHPINAEHVRPEIKGHIVSAGFSKFDPNYENGATTEIITEEYVIENYLDNMGVFNICLGGVLYVVVDSGFCQKILDASDPDSKDYLSYSASWELAFSDYVLVAGDKILANCEIIEDEDRINELSQYAKFSGGKGYLPDGRPVFRWIYGDVMPLGIGITENPAGHVKGIAVVSSDDPDEEENEQTQEDTAAQISQNENADVIIIKDKETPIMKNKIKTIEELKGLTDEKLVEVEASSIKDVIEGEIKRVCDEYAAKVQEEKVAKEAAAKQAEDAIAKLTALEGELTKIKEEQARAANEQKFNERMSMLDEKFNLGDEERKVIVAEINGLEDEAFDAWFKKFSVLAKSLAKDFIDPKLEEVKQQAEASKKLAEDKDKEIESLKAAKASGGVPNTISGTGDLKEKLNKMKESIKISA